VSTTTTDFTALAPIEVVRQESDGTVVVPALLAGRCLSARTRLLRTIGERPVKVAIASDLVQQQMVERARRAFPALQRFAAEDWWHIFAQAADQLECWIEEDSIELALQTVSACGGLPPGRVERGVLGVVNHLRRLREILAVQAPQERLDSFQNGLAVPDDRSWTRWSWRPAGRMCAVRGPGNFPTMAVEWLQVIGSRRPVVVVNSDGDPVISSLVAAALYGAGLPPDALSVCHGVTEVIWREADQLVWPGEDIPSGVTPNRVKTYHFGRSKAVLMPGGVEPETWQRLTRLAFQGSGRLCTNLSSLVVVGQREDAEAAARSLADGFAEIPLLDLQDPVARVPAWPDTHSAEAVAATIEREVAAGAVDVTEGILDAPVLVIRDGQTFLRPTVLLAETHSSLFGTELPFPFVAVAPVSREAVVGAVCNSLIVSVLDTSGDDQELLEALATEPTISKVFAGEHFDRGYEPTDPHEGYLADFLFQKKPLRFGADVKRAYD
jgi:thienamycin biosynthesis protein ThnO